MKNHFLHAIIALALFTSCAPKRGLTVEDIVRKHGAAADARLRPSFQKAGVAYPPANVILIGLKEEKTLELWAGTKDTAPRFIRSYPILAASGQAGPKLRQGDKQVPEGEYAIEAFNPNSSYHLSMKINYPNEFDRENARRDRRIKLGGDIFLHGSDESVGCVAIGDRAIEDLFILATRVGKERVEVLLAPRDLRAGKAAPQLSPSWTFELYRRLKQRLQGFLR